MKKYCYIMSIIAICFTMCSVTFAATTLKDIKGTDYEEAVENLIEIGLVNGYPEDNTYRPNVVVTRAQMAKMMVIALGEEDKVEAAAKKSATFTDIKSGHWAYGYVNVAKDLGIINGYPDGRFGPEDTVTYAEASTMALRALGYEDEVAKSTENWPNNYITYGKKLSLFDSMDKFDSGKGAARGDVALLLWNMLRTGVCTAIEQTNSGIKYGEGERMIYKYKNYIYEDDAIITKVTFDSDFSEADVTITGDKNVKITMYDSDVLDYYARKLEILYNMSTKKLISISDSKKYTEVDGNVTNVTSKKIYLDGDDYTLPDSANILLYKTDKLANAIDATVYMSGSSVKYILATGAKAVYVGVVTANGIKVNENEGIKLKKVGSSSDTSYALIDDDYIPNKGSIIIYYLNSDNELGIVKEIDIDDAKTISTATSTKIKVNSTTYTYSSSTFVTVTATSSKVSNMTFSNIDKSKDLAYVYEYAGKTYVIVYEDCADDSEAKAEALAELKKCINDYAYLEKSEASYSQSTFTRFLNAMSTGRSMTSSSRMIKINDALTELKAAKTALKTVSSYSTEGKIASYRAKIRALITTGDTIVTNKAQYTTSSYDAFYTKYVAAKELLKQTDNTQAEAETMYNELNSVMSSSKLIKIVDTQNHKEAVANLNSIISTYGNVTVESNYTQISFNAYKTAKENALNGKKNYASTSYEKLNQLASELKTAYDKLELAIDAIKDELNELILDFMVYEETSGDYMPETYVAFTKAMDEALKARKETDLAKVRTALEKLKTAKNNLKEIDVVLKETKTVVTSMNSAPLLSEVLKMTENTSKDQLDKITAINNAVKSDLNNLITRARAEITTASGEAFVKLLDATSEAQTALDSEVIADMVSAYVKLNALLPKQQ